jgi:hypothetical protein
MTLTTPGNTAALWLGALWYAAPVLTPRSEAIPRDAASRIRDAIALGVAIPLVLGALGLLTATACEVALAILVVVRSVVRPPRIAPAAVSFSRRRVPGAAGDLVGSPLPAVAAVCVSWPQIARPLMQGDSIAYHLPNAAAWSTTHSLWTSGTWYWFYPGGSELFAAALFSVAGPPAVALAGFVALLLFAQRLASFAVRAGFSRLGAGAVAAAVVTIKPIALQGGSLENDVWLAAWTLEVAWALLEERSTASRALAVTSLVKPYGFVFALLAAVAGRVPWRQAALGIAPFAFWVVRDAVLWPHATIDPLALAYRHTERTTIAWQGVAGLTTLGSALWNTGAGMLLAALALAVTAVTSGERVLRWTAIGTFAFFLLEPYGFRDDNPQLATGASLRFLVPALALGLTGALPLLRRFVVPTTIGCLALCAYQTYQVTAIFAIDPISRGWGVPALALGAAIVLDAGLSRGVVSGLVGLALVHFIVRLPATDPASYYDDALSRGPQRSHFFDWLVKARPSAIVGDQILLGYIVMMSPRTLAQNTVRVDPCGEARRASAFLAIADDPPTNATEFAARRAYGRACGTERYDDGDVLVVEPRGLRAGSR